MLDIHALKQRERYEKHVWAVRLRATTLLGVTFVYGYLALTGRVPFDLFALALLVGLFAFNATRLKKITKSFTRFMIGTDILLITLAIWATGGVATFLLPLYFVQVVATSLHTNPRQGVGTALTAWALFAGVALLEAVGVLPHGPLSPSPSSALLARDLGFVEAQIMGLFVLLGAVTYSSGFIAQRLRVREHELAVAHDELEILYHASQRFQLVDSSTALAHELCRASMQLGARAAGVFLMGDEGESARCLALTPDPAPEGLAEALQGRAEAWLSRGEDARSLMTLRDDPDYGLVRFQLPDGRPGVLAVRVALEDLVGGSAEGISLLAQNFAAAYATLDALEAHVHMATTDPLTGAANRREFDRVLADELERGHRYGRPVSLVLVDVDHFKKLNDTRGHQEGDRVLQGVVQAMGRVVRAQDTLARYGGEEFAVIAPETGPSQGVILAERLRRGIRETAFFDDGALVTASLGVSSYQPGGDPATSAAMIQRADAALYRAKEGGRDRVEGDRGEPAGDP